MKIRLLGDGYAQFTGAFGTTEFVDGVSVDQVSPAQARFFAALMTIEDVDGSGDPGDNAKFQKSLELEAVSVTLPLLTEVLPQESLSVLTNLVTTLMSPEATVYTKEMLEEIADKDGIAGLRLVGDPLGVKSASITKLIDAILDKQNPEPAAAPLASVNDEEQEVADKGQESTPVAE